MWFSTCWLLGTCSEWPPVPERQRASLPAQARSPVHLMPSVPFLPLAVALASRCPLPWPCLSHPEPWEQVFTSQRCVQSASGMCIWGQLGTCFLGGTGSHKLHAQFTARRLAYGSSTFRKWDGCPGLWLVPASTCPHHPAFPAPLWWDVMLGRPLSTQILLTCLKL